MLREYAGKPLGFWRYLLAALLLTALPFLAMYIRSLRVENGTELRLPVSMERVEDRAFAPQIWLQTPLNTIAIKSVAGDNNFVEGGRVFVFLSPGPSAVWYPYAVSRRAPQKGCEITDCLVLSGRVATVKQNEIDIVYQFENYVPSKAVLAKLPETNNGYSKGARAEVSLSVSKDGRAYVRALHLGGETISQPTIPLTLDGLIHRGESKAPATNPPT